MAKFFREFREFAVKGNVIDMAVGIIIGGAFTLIVQSLVKDVMNPLIGLLVGGIDFSNLFVVLREGVAGAPYATLAEAQAAGAVTLNVGLFINAVVSFSIVRGVFAGAYHQPLKARRGGGTGRPDRKALPLLFDGGADQGRSLRSLYV